MSVAARPVRVPSNIVNNFQFRDMSRLIPSFQYRNSRVRADAVLRHISYYRENISTVRLNHDEYYQSHSTQKASASHNECLDTPPPGLIYVILHRSVYQIPISLQFHHPKKKFSIPNPPNATGTNPTHHHAHEIHRVLAQHHFVYIEYQPKNERHPPPRFYHQHLTATAWMNIVPATPYHKLPKPKTQQ